MGDKDKKKKHDESDESASDSSASDSSSKKSKHKEKDKKHDKHKSKDKHKKDKKDKKGKKSSKSEKEKVKTKSSKRGPKGAQWVTWKIPYQESSILGRSFALAQKKGGVDIKKLSKQIKAWGGTPAFILRKLRKGHSKGFKWEVDDANGRLRILGCKLVDKKWHK